MQFKDYYRTLGVAREASADEVKRAYRKLARKFHPDVSKEADAENRFKEVGEAYEVLQDPEKRAAYDAAGTQWERQRQAGAGGRDAEFRPPPGWAAGRTGGASPFEAGFDAGEHSDFFEALFGRNGRAAAGRERRPGADQHAKVTIDLEDSYRGAERSIELRVPSADGTGATVWRERRLDISIPKGIREGQHLRLAGQGLPGSGGAPAGDLYLEIAFNPHRRFRVDGRDVYVDLPVAPWEAALGASISVATPDREIELAVPAASAAGRKLRLKGQGIPGTPPGDFYAVLQVVLPPADDARSRSAYEAFRDAVDFDPRRGAAP